MSEQNRMLEEKRIELALKLTDAQAEIRKLRQALLAAIYVLELTSPESPKFVNSASLSPYDKQEIGRILNMCRAALKGGS